MKEIQEKDQYPVLDDALGKFSLNLSICLCNGTLNSLVKNFSIGKSGGLKTLINVTKFNENFNCAFDLIRKAESFLKKDKKTINNIEALEKEVTQLKKCIRKLQIAYKKDVNFEKIKEFAAVIENSLAGIDTNADLIKKALDTTFEDIRSKVRETVGKEA